MKSENRYILDSYLITGDDYADFQLAARKLKTGRTELFLFRLLGMALILTALLGRVYFDSPDNYNSMVYFLLICLGVGICLYYDFCMPYVVRRHARRYLLHCKAHQR